MKENKSWGANTVSRDYAFDLEYFHTLKKYWKVF